MYSKILQGAFSITSILVGLLVACCAVKLQVRSLPFTEDTVLLILKSLGGVADVLANKHKGNKHKEKKYSLEALDFRTIFNSFTQPLPFIEIPALGKVCAQ